MKKTIFNKSGMKQIINSGYKLFDNQTNLISTGNVISNTQYSSYVRPYNEVKNGGYIGKQGDFLKYDLQFFGRIPKFIEDIIMDKNRENSVILYQFHVYKNGKKDILGYVMTDKDHNFINCATMSYFGQKWAYKRENAIGETLKYVCNENDFIKY